MQALEALRKLRTEKSSEIKQYKLQLDHLKTHKVSLLNALHFLQCPCAILRNARGWRFVSISTSVIDTETQIAMFWGNAPT